MEVGWNWDTHRAHYCVTAGEEFDYFNVTAKMFVDVAGIMRHKDALLAYTQRPDNQIIEIYEAVPVTHDSMAFQTRLYPHWQPLVFISECMSMYSPETFEACSRAYRRKLKQPGFDWQKSYDHIVDEMQEFTDATGLRFMDISGNNILVEPMEYGDLRVIDVGSIAECQEDYFVDPVDLFLSQKVNVDNHLGDPFLLEYVGDWVDAREQFSKIKPRYVRR